MRLDETMLPLSFILLLFAGRAHVNHVACEGVLSRAILLDKGKRFSAATTKRVGRRPAPCVEPFVDGYDAIKLTYLLGY